eukprot:739909-Prorocentrum_minimum.AAC.3
MRTSIASVWSSGARGQSPLSLAFSLRPRPDEPLLPRESKLSCLAWSPRLELEHGVPPSKLRLLPFRLQPRELRSPLRDGLSESSDDRMLSDPLCDPA